MPEECKGLPFYIDAWKRLQTDLRGRVDSFDWSPDDEQRRIVALATRELGITPTLAEVIAFAADEELSWRYGRSPESLYEGMLAWLKRHIT